MNYEPENRWTMPIVILGKKNCQFCKRALNLCTSRQVFARYYDVEDMQSQSANSSSLAMGFDLGDILKEAGFTTVPIIFHAGQLIGGYVELETYLELGYVPS